MGKFNVTQAVAMDSGGSTSFVEEGILVNYGSDNRPPSCPEGIPYECERPTSTALCIHDGAEVEEESFNEKTPGLIGISGAGFFGLSMLLCFGGALTGAIAWTLLQKKKRPRSVAIERQVSSATDDTTEA